MTDFDTLLANATEKGKATVHGALFKCVDKNGNELYSKIAGYDSLSEDASPLRWDAVLKAASATKLFTSIALLQCVDKGLIGLDEPITGILPELDSKTIVTGENEEGLTFEKSKTKITPRMLVNHTSGLSYFFLNPLLMKWIATPEGKKNRGSKIMSERYDPPLVFEPGTGWTYGCGLDWAGVAVRRLHDDMSLGDYMVENIWKKLGLTAPFPTFYLSGDLEYKARLMGGAERTPEGELKSYEFWQGDGNADDQEGGAGLSLTAKDFLAVLTDLISDTPKLLKASTVSEMFTPQLPRDSPAIQMLIKLRVAWDTVAGPVSEDAVNHGLGGMLITAETPEVGQPKNILGWGGAANTVWFACRELGVAGLMSTQLHPFGDAKVKQLINAWKKDFWSSYLK